MTVIQVYAPTSDYDDSEVEDFYGQLQEVIEETPKKDNLIVLGDWNAKVEKMRRTTGKTLADLSATRKQMREVTGSSNLQCTMS